MGFFDSFKSGAKDVFKGYDKVKLKEKITYDELYEIMKDETYSVGKPEITGSGLMRCIQFPAVDKYKIQISLGRSQRYENRTGDPSFSRASCSIGSVGEGSRRFSERMSFNCSCISG